MAAFKDNANQPSFGKIARRLDRNTLKFTIATFVLSDYILGSFLFHQFAP
jgi:hypothetical protein